MFTGLIETTGTVNSVRITPAGLMAGITASFSPEVTAGQSICVSGVCLTVTAVTDQILYFDIMEKTIRDTTFKKLKKGDYVNLERALRADSRLDGHLVTGHVHCTGKVKKISTGKLHDITISYPDKFQWSAKQKGSVSVSGVSLTVQESGAVFFTVSIIPETIRRTTLRFLKTGDSVNLEFDTGQSFGIKSDGLTLEKLRSMGY